MKKTICTIVALVCILISANAQYKKSVSILGDSYSTFEGFLQPDTNAVWYWKKEKDPNRTDVNSVQQTWWQLFLRKNGYRLCVNNSFSGATISFSGYKKNLSTHPDYSDRSFITRADNLGCPDILFIFGGTNDAWANSPIGEYQYSNWTHEDLFAFRPAMACLLQKVTDRYPNVKIYFILNDGLKAEITESITTVCKKYDIACIELHDIDKISKHPSIKGMKQIYEQVQAYIEDNNNSDH